MKDREESFPETIEEYLECPGACVSRFNRCGTILAVGAQGGRCFLWDFVTRGCIKMLRQNDAEAAEDEEDAEGTREGDVGSLRGIEWSCDGRNLLCWDDRPSLRLWNVLDGEEEAQVALPDVPVRALMHPTCKWKCIVCLADGKAMAVELQGKGAKKDLNIGGKHVMDVAYFGQGTSIFLACKAGEVQEILENEDGSFRPGRMLKLSASIRRASISNDSNVMLVQCEDEILRIVQLKGNLNVDHEFLSSKGKKKVPWKCACLSACGTYVLAATNSASEQNIYVWKRSAGTLSSILEGPHEGVEDMAWHPEKDILVTVCNSGYMYIWAKTYVENWSAFAPDFQELSHNVEYVEREDEFDMNGRDQEHEKKPAIIEEVDDGTVIDILGGPTTDKADTYLHHLPVEVDADVDTLEQKAPLPGQRDDQGAPTVDATARAQESTAAAGDAGKRKKKPRTDTVYEQ